MRNKVYKSNKFKASGAATEREVHKSICTYIRTKYPEVIFFSDMSGLKTSIGVAMQMKALRSSRAIPDLFICSPRGGYAGLFLEIKSDDVKLFLKDGSFTKEKHITEQAAMLDTLKHLGYASYFAVGLKMASDIVDEYMQGKVFPVE